MEMMRRAPSLGPGPDADEQQSSDTAGASQRHRMIMVRRLRQRRGKERDESQKDGAGAAASIDVAGLARSFISLGWRDVNRITDQVFWKLHPELAGQKLEAGSPEAGEWMRLRDEVVCPAVEAAPPVAAGPHAEQTGPATAQRDGQPAAQDPATPPAPQTHAPPPSPASGGGDHYFTQNENSYSDSHSKAYGASSGWTCNMTSLAMTLTSLCNGDEERARQAVAAQVRQRLAMLPPDAGFEIKGQKMPVSEVVANPNVLDGARLPDLLIALAGTQLRREGFLSVTEHDFIMQIAKETGIATQAKAPEVDLADPKQRERLKEALGRGEKVMLGSVRHMLYGVAAAGDGIILHDPAGARINPGLHGAIFFHSGARWDQWDSLLDDPKIKETVLRRVSTNPTALNAITRLLEAKKLSGHARSAALKGLKNEAVEMGAFNYYGPEDFATYQLRWCMSFNGGAPAQ